MKNQFTFLIMILLFVMLAAAACAGTSESPQPAEDAGLPPVAAIKARKQLSKALNIPVAEITIVGQEQAEWSDTCLGLGGPAESCMLLVVPGWRVELSANGETYIAHTDELGDQVRFE